ncbi:MAG: hypothetical protein RR461_11715 [Angelakisella sp.]
MKGKFAGLLEKLKPGQQNLIFIAGLAGILLIAFAQLPSWDNKAPPKEPESQPVAESSYEEKLEKRLSEILGSIAGVGKVNVMVTLESGYGYEYAKENKVDSNRSADITPQAGQKTQEKNTTEESYVMLEASGGEEKPLVTKELSPQIKGVVVVCEGGGNAATISSIIETVKVAVNISSAQISVSKMG